MVLGVQESNELNHLLIMEALGGDQLWVDRFFAQHCAGGLLVFFPHDLSKLMWLIKCVGSSLV